MFFCDDNNEESRPVAENTQEVGQDLREMFTSGDTSNSVDDEGKENPEEPWD